MSSPRSSIPKRARRRVSLFWPPFSKAKPMELWPSIDLLGGKVVRLHQGDYDKVTVYHDDPVALAASWRGVARHLHVVDLEGARSGRRVEGDLVARIVQAFGDGVEVAGGIRDREAIETCLATGAQRVVLG